MTWWRPPGAAGRRAWGCQAEAVRRGAVPVTIVGALVRYLETPVGAYDEVAVAIALARLERPGVHVPFIAVDSPASLAAGRRNWALPKTPATFSGEPGPGTAGAEGSSWHVSAAPSRSGPAVPVRLWLTLLQLGPDGRRCSAPLDVRARASPAWVSVETTGAGGPLAWLPAGRWIGAVLEGTLTLGPAG